MINYSCKRHCSRGDAGLCRMAWRSLPCDCPCHVDQTPKASPSNPEPSPLATALATGSAHFVFSLLSPKNATPNAVAISDFTKAAAPVIDRWIASAQKPKLKEPGK